MPWGGPGCIVPPSDRPPGSLAKVGLSSLSVRKPSQNSEELLRQETRAPADIRRYSPIRMSRTSSLNFSRVVCFWMHSRMSARSLSTEASADSTLMRDKAFRTRVSPSLCRACINAASSRGVSCTFISSSSENALKISNRHLTDGTYHGYCDGGGRASQHHVPNSVQWSGLLPGGLAARPTGAAQDDVPARDEARAAGIRRRDTCRVSREHFSLWSGP